MHFEIIVCSRAFIIVKPVTNVTVELLQEIKIIFRFLYLNIYVSQVLEVSYIRQSSV